ncbi:hypothetical protein V8E53_008844 [Lactarius tabidus]
MPMRIDRYRWRNSAQHPTRPHSVAGPSHRFTSSLLLGDWPHPNIRVHAYICPFLCPRTQIALFHALSPPTLLHLPFSRSHSAPSHRVSASSIAMPRASTRVKRLAEAPLVSGWAELAHDEGIPVAVRRIRHFVIFCCRHLGGGKDTVLEDGVGPIFVAFDRSLHDGLRKVEDYAKEYVQVEGNSRVCCTVCIDQVLVLAQGYTGSLTNRLGPFSGMVQVTAPARYVIRFSLFAE